MLCIQRYLGLGVFLAVTSAGASARAIETHSEMVYFVPTIGAEYVGIASAALRMNYQGVDTTGSSGVGLAYGAHAGLVLGTIRLGVLFQQTRMFETEGLNFNKVYVEAGIGGRRGIVGLSLSLAGGWAFFSARAMPRRNGGGARATFAADFYLSRYFSLGPEISVDGAGYTADETVYGSWGMTGALRLGFHL